MPYRSLSAGNSVMALTLEVEQRLTRSNLAKFFADHEAAWKGAASQAYKFVRDGFPAGATIRPDDVAKALLPILEVNERLKSELSAKKLTQKYWVSNFVDLLVDRTWADLP
jgi:hypothetical protein